MKKNTNIKQSKNIFSTSNFALAIYLKSKMCRLLHITKNDSNHATFDFENTAKREELTKEFWEDSGLVEPKRFYNSQRELKSLLYQDGNYSNNCVSRCGSTVTSA